MVYETTNQYLGEEFGVAEINLSKTSDGHTFRAVVMVGPPDRAGYRAKDGEQARRYRKAIRRAVAELYNIPIDHVRAVSRFTRLQSDGTLVDNTGKPVGWVKL